MITTPMAAAITYQDVKPMIFKMASTFHRMSGGNFEELVSICNESFVEAYESHQSEKASFVTWFHIQMWYAMNNWWRKEMRYYKNYLCIDTQSNLESLPIKSRQSPRQLDFTEMSPDGQELISYALIPPPEVIKHFQANQSQYSSFRKAIKDCLRQTGWTTRRVREAISEVRRMLVHA